MADETTGTAGVTDRELDRMREYARQFDGYGDMDFWDHLPAEDAEPFRLYLAGRAPRQEGEADGEGGRA